MKKPNSEESKEIYNEKDNDDITWNTMTKQNPTNINPPALTELLRSMVKRKITSRPSMDQVVSTLKRIIKPAIPRKSSNQAPPAKKAKK